MIVIRVALRVKPEARSHFVEHMQQEVRETRELAGCERFELFGDLVDSDRFFIFEEWTDRSAFSAYRDSEFFARNRQQIFALLADKPDSAYYASEQFGP